jgi:hypothetical protein
MSAISAGKPYVLPQDVIAPRYRMHVIDILIDGGEERACSYALQHWIEEDEYSIGVRWNGDEEKPNGTPNISGHACWLVLDKMLWPAVLAAVADHTKRAQAARLLYRGL